MRTVLVLPCGLGKPLAMPALLSRKQHGETAASAAISLLYPHAAQHCGGLTPSHPSPPARAGAISTPPAEKRKLARESLAYNVRNPTFRCAAPRPGS